MPRKQKSQPKKKAAEKPEVEPTKIKIKFVEMSRVSKYLYCSICQDVLNDPVCPSCQHTFCRDCINTWINNQRYEVQCPVCRKPIRKPQIQKNLLAYQLLNELEIFCSNQAAGCEWRGQLETITNHLPNCSYRTGQLPEWYSKYLVSKEEEVQKQELQEMGLEEHIRDRLQQEKVEPLAVRLFKQETQPELQNQLQVLVTGNVEQDDATSNQQSAQIRAQGRSPRRERSAFEDQEETKERPPMPSLRGAQQAVKPRSVGKQTFKSGGSQVQDMLNDVQNMQQDFEFEDHSEDGVGNLVDMQDFMNERSSDVKLSHGLLNYTVDEEEENNEEESLKRLLMMGFDRKITIEAFEAFRDEQNAAEFLAETCGNSKQQKKQLAAQKTKRRKLDRLNQQTQKQDGSRRENQQMNSLDKRRKRNIPVKRVDAAQLQPSLALIPESSLEQVEGIKPQAAGLGNEHQETQASSNMVSKQSKQPGECLPQSLPLPLTLQDSMPQALADQVHVVKAEQQDEN